MDSDEKLTGAIDRFNKTKQATSAQPTHVVKTVSKRDEHGRIAEVTETRIADAATADAVVKVATEAVEAAVQVVKDAERRASITAGQLSAEVAQAVVEAAKKTAEEVAARHVKETIEDFKRAEDEAYDEEDDETDDLEDETDLEIDAQDQEDPRLFRSAAKAEADIERDLGDLVTEKIQPVVDEVTRLTEQQKEIGRAIVRRRAEIDGLAYAFKELGSWEAVRSFFKLAKSKPLTADHPFVADPHLRVFRFPDAGPGRLSDETTDESNRNRRQTMQNIGTPKFMSRGRQTMDGRKPDDMPNDPDQEIQDLSGPGGSGGQDFRTHKAPQADAVLLSEQSYRPRKVIRHGKRRGLWSGR